MSVPGSEGTPGKRNMIAWGTSLKHTLKYKMLPSLWAYSPAEDAGEYEHLCQRGGIFSSEVALFLWPGKPMRLKKALVAADQLSPRVVPLVLWQGVVPVSPWAWLIYFHWRNRCPWGDHQNSDNWVGDSGKQLLNNCAHFSMIFYTYSKTGLHFSFRGEKKSIKVCFYLLSSPDTPLYNKSNVENLFQTAPGDTVNK